MSIRYCVKWSVSRVYDSITYYMYRHVVVAGTFDRLHRGHEAVLTRAFAEGELVTMGLTSDEYVQKFKISREARSSFAGQNSTPQILSFKERKQHLLDWLATHGFMERATIVALHDPFGPVVPQSPHDPAQRDIEAIIVSTDTRARAQEINRLRREAGWKPLTIIEVPMVAAEDIRPISSTRVRNKEIDRQGRLIMPDNLRPELKKPLGRVLVGDEIIRSIRSHLAKQGETLIITVGDVATKTLLDAGVTPSLAIIDGKVGRKPYSEALKCLTRSHLGKQGETFIKLQSGPGYISDEALEAIRGSFTKTKAMVIIVDGEEDLLALPVIAYAPVGARVYYGQPPLRPSTKARDFEGQARGGLVEVVVTSEKKQEAVALLGRFT